MQRTRALRQLITDSHYEIDAQQVAQAILLRAQAKATMPDITFRNDRNPAAVRSFRLEHEVRSFRLSTRRRSRQLQH
jgi:hypothetical protein